MNRDLVIKKLREYYTLKELFNKESVKKFVAEEIKTDNYGYAKLLTSLQKYTKDFSEIKVGSETIDMYVSRYTGSFKKSSGYSADKYVINPSKDGYENYLEAAFDCFGDKKGAINAIGDAFEANQEIKDLVSSLAIKVGGATRKSNSLLIADNISYISSVAGLKGNASEKDLANSKLNERIEKLQLRLKDEVSKVKDLKDIGKLNGKELEKINRGLTESLQSLTKTFDKHLGSATGAIIRETKNATKDINEHSDENTNKILNAVNNKSKRGKKRIAVFVGGTLASALFGGTVAWLIKPNKVVEVDNASAIQTRYSEYEAYAKDEDNEYKEFVSILNKFQESANDVTREQVDSYLKTGEWNTANAAKLAAKEKSFNAQSMNIQNISSAEIALGNQIVNDFAKNDKTNVVEVNGVKFDYSDKTRTENMRTVLDDIKQEKSINDLKSNVSSLENDATELNDKIKELETQLNNSGNDEELKAQIAELKTQVAEKAATIKELENQLKEAQDKNTLTETEKATLQSQLDAAKTELDSAKKNIDNLESQLAEANNTIAELQAALSESQKQINDIINTLVGLGYNKNDNVITYLQNLSKEYEQLKSDYKTLEENYNTLGADYSTLQSDYNTLNSKNAELNQKLEEANAVVKELEARVNELNSTIKGLEDKLAAQADYATIKAEYEKLKTLVAGIPEEELNNIGSVKAGLQSICEAMGLDTNGMTSYDMLVVIGNKLGVPMDKTPTSPDAGQDEKQPGNV